MITDGELRSDGIDLLAMQGDLKGGSITWHRWSRLRRQHRSDGGWSR